MVSWSCSRCRSTTDITTTASSCQEPDHTLHNYQSQFAAVEWAVLLQHMKQCCVCQCNGVTKHWTNVNFLKLRARLIFLLVILNVFTSSLASQPPPPSSTSHHVTTHTVNTKYGPLRGLRVQFSSSSTRHLGKLGREQGHSK